MNAFRWTGVGAVILAAILWGTTGTVQAQLPDGREPFAVAAIRLFFGAVMLIAMAAARPHSRDGLFRLPWGGIVFAGVAIGAYNLLFFWAVLETGVGIGTAVAIGSAPVWTTAFEVTIRKSWPGPVRVLGQCVAISGVVLLGLTSGGAEGSLAGLALALCAGACYAAYSLATSRISHLAPSTAIAGATFSVAALVTAPVLFVVPLNWLSAPSTWLALGFLGLCATGLSYALYTWGLTRISASTAVTLALAEPVTAWLLATLVIGEAVTLAGSSGVLLIFAGLVAVTVPNGRR